MPNDENTTMRLPRRRLSARMLTRLGEAADGHPGRPVWFVASYEPVQIKGFFFSEAEAESFVEENQLDGNFDIFGPFESRMNEAAALKNSPSVEEVVVKFRATDGTLQEQPISGTDFDAIFWSASVLDKLVLPYYAGVSGLDFAVELNARFNEPSAHLIAHKPDSRSEPVLLVEPSGDPGVMPPERPGDALRFIVLSPD